LEDARAYKRFIVRGNVTLTLFVMIFVYGHYYLNHRAWLGHEREVHDCYAGIDGDAPVHMKTSENISGRMLIAIKLGFYVHLIGFVAALWRLVNMQVKHEAY